MQVHQIAALKEITTQSGIVLDTFESRLDAAAVKAGAGDSTDLIALSVELQKHRTALGTVVAALGL